MIQNNPLNGSKKMYVIMKQKACTGSDKLKSKYMQNSNKEIWTKCSS